MKATVIVDLFGVNTFEEIPNEENNLVIRDDTELGKKLNRIIDRLRRDNIGSYQNLVFIKEGFEIFN